MKNITLCCEEHGTWTAVKSKERNTHLSVLFTDGCLLLPAAFRSLCQLYGTRRSCVFRRLNIVLQRPFFVILMFILNLIHAKTSSRIFFISPLVLELNMFFYVRYIAVHVSFQFLLWSGLFQFSTSHTVLHDSFTENPDRMLCRKCFCIRNMTVMMSQLCK